MKKILLSVMTIALVATAGIAATRAYFTDTESSVGNTFTAGTIDISVDDMNPWNKTFTMADMKPSYVDYINFEIENTGSDPNPVNVWKNIHVTNESTGAVSEPECSDQNGTWNNDVCTWGGVTEDNNDLSAAIWYDLYVEVYNANNDKVWWQTIYVDADHNTIDSVYGVNGDGKVYLGMIPANGKMKVKQSYHLATDTGNWAQGDQMTFDITLTAEQLQGTAKLENKTAAPDYKLVLGDGIDGTLTYAVKNPTFKYTFAGKAPVGGVSYTLLAAKDPWPQVGSTVLGTTTSAGDGTVNFSGDVELNGDLKDSKVWLVLSSDWNGTQMIGWHQTSYLLETGLIWYEDTDL